MENRIDLNPLDVTDDDVVAWLSHLIWPGETDRADRLAQAVATARLCPPTIHRGDLLGDLARVAAGAPSDATLVVYHSAVLAYLSEEKRRAFVDAVSRTDAVWLSNKGDRVLRCTATYRQGPGSFLLVRDGREILARADPHATWSEWLDTLQ